MAAATLHRNILKKGKNIYVEWYQLFMVGDESFLNIILDGRVMRQTSQRIEKPYWFTPGDSIDFSVIESDFWIG